MPTDSVPGLAGAEGTVAPDGKSIRVDIKTPAERESEAEADLDKKLRAKFRESHKDSDDEDEGDDEPDEDDEEDDEESEPEKAARERGKDGKFKASAEAEAAKALAAKEAQDKEAADEKAADKKAEADKAKEAKKPEKEAKPAKDTSKKALSPDKEVDPAKPPRDMPKSWPAEKKVVWDKLPSEAQEHIEQREQQAHKIISEQGQRLKAYEPLSKVITDNQHVFARHKATPHEGIAALIGVQEQLDHDAPAAIRAIAKMYEVDVEFPGLSEDYDHPQVKALREENYRLKQQQQAQQLARQRHAQQVKAQTQSSNAELIESFAKDKPDFARLEPEIFRQVHALNRTETNLSAAEVLQRAYEAAQQLDPQSREERIKAEAKKLAEEQAKAAKSAKDAKVLNVGEDANDEEGEDDDDDGDALLRKTYRKATKRQEARA